MLKYLLVFLLFTRASQAASFLSFLDSDNNSLRLGENLNTFGSSLEIGKT